MSSSIQDALDGARILITGVTGFLGTALLERVLTDLPATRVVLLARGRDGRAPEDRVSDLFQGNAFRDLRAREGSEGIRRILEERIEVVTGDVAEDVPDLPGDLDLVFHCAATVSFDSPVDTAFRINVLGPKGLYEAVARAGGRPHVVHVSTAYVAGSTKGIVPEAPLAHEVDWAAEARYALAAREQVEEASRRPEVLDRLMAKAEREHRRAGPGAVAEASEEHRRQWVSRRLVEYGRARAQSVGWPDVYTFTKALGERAVEQVTAANELPLSIVRPSIIESALQRPYPGWIEGFKMAEPIILAFGRGRIPEFPAIPEGVMDFIPVDLVVNAMMAVGSRRPAAGSAQYFHVSSGSRNPLSFRGLYENVREYFLRHPLPERGRGTVAAPVWSFPGRRRVEGMLRTGERLARSADRAVRALPRSGRVRDLVRRLDRERGKLDFLRRYADLYGAYTETEVIYTDHRTLALFRSLSQADRERYPFDVAVVDWGHYLQEVHCPAIDVALRFPAPARPEPTVRVRPSENGVAAVFDMEGTVVDSNVVESYLWLRLAELERDEWGREITRLSLRLPAYVGAERRYRGEFLRTFYRRYRGASAEGVQRLVDEHVGELILHRLAPAAVRRIREHRAAGHRTILITGALDCFVRPLEPLFDEIVPTRLAVREGRFTGDLVAPPLVGDARAAWLRARAGTEGIDLERSYAYADSHSDLPLLRAVGNPVAVNPDVALYRVARSRRWPVEEWRRSGGTPRVMVPERVP